MPSGFTETVVPGPSGGSWNEAVGIAFDSTGRLFAWERSGRVWFKDLGGVSFSLLLDISEEVGGYNDLGLLGFVLDPNFQVNGHIYLLYNVDRHHLLRFGTPSYNPSSNEYDAATIGRLTRYTCTSSNGFRSVNLASRLILIGETKQTGMPMCSDTHGIGSLVFGQDGTLLVSSGDGATPWAADIGGAQPVGYAPQALSDGIIRTKENVGAFRSQLVDCLNGKVLRIDPATGDGIPSNLYYDPANPRAPRSRVWVLGLRNPFRMSLRPESGSHNPADGNPGVLYIGEVGWNNWESLKVATGPGQNFGWPTYEGLSITPPYNGADYNVDIPNMDAPNPLYPTSGCSQYFSFRQLLKQDTLDTNSFPPFANPCSPSLKIPASIPQFLQTRPVLDWNHGSAITRTPTYSPSGQAQTANVGAGGSPVSGTQFQGNCAIGGTWYTGTNFPAQYQNTYFLADWGQGVMKKMTFDQNNRPLSVSNFLSSGGAIVCVVQHPFDGSLYYAAFDNESGATAVRQITYTGNRTPVGVASANLYFGPGPLTVQFTGSGSSDPDGQSITYSWNFGDGSPNSTQANPSHTFSAPPGVPTKFTVTLTVTDSGGLSAQTTLIISVNNTPPNVTITSPTNGTLYSPSDYTVVNLNASVSDTEFNHAQLLYQWRTFLHHNDHKHGDPVDTNQVTTTVIAPTGCDGVNIYYYSIALTVSDPAGLSTTHEVRIYPDCGPNTPPTISDIPNQTTTSGSSVGPINFTIGDSGVAAANLQLSAGSSNPTLVPINNIVFGGSGSNRTVTVTPAVGQTGNATITVSVSDGPLSANDTFNLAVNSPPPSSIKSFTNTTAITIPGVGNGTPYPSTINVSSMGGSITNVTVTLRNMSHTYPADIDVLLVGPGGQKAMIFSDVGGSGDINNVTLTLSDAAATALTATGQIVSGTNRPTDVEPGETGNLDTFSSPAPGGPYAAPLSAFNGQGANGTWSLYVVDDGPGDQGSFAGGWSIRITTVSSGSQSPTISDIANQFTSVNTPTPAIPFTIGDADTPVTSLALSATSSNLTLVPTNNIVFGGSGSNRTVTVTPAAGQTGTSIVTVTVSDGTNSANDNFVLTVNAVNTPPTISSITNRTINEDTSTGSINFTIGDAETVAGSLTLGKASSNTTLVPTNSIVFGGSGANRTVTVTPATNQNGVATITVSVSDGQLSVSTNFTITVNAENDAPTISSIGNQTINVNGTTGPLNFTVGDVETAAGSLTLGKVSSNTTLVPTNNIVFGGSGASRTVTVTPVAGQSGSATITVSVSDGQLVASNSFVLTVNTLPTGAVSFTNMAAITIPNQGTASPYPSTINVTGMSGTISNVTVTLQNMSHTFPDDLDVLLVGPGGQKVLILSDTGGGGDLNNVTVTLSDLAASTLSNSGQIGAGTFKPTNYGTSDSFQSPAPGSPYGATLSAFYGQTANGAWSLYVVDDGSGDQGSFAGGWSVTITTAAAVPQPPTISNIPDQSTATNTPTAAIPFTVGDLDTPVNNLSLGRNSSNLALVPTNNIVFGGSGTNRTVTVTPVAGQTGVATITVSVSDGALTASDTFVLTVSTLPTGTRSFTNTASITIPGLGNGTPYPSTISVTGMGGTITNVTAMLRNMNHTYPADIDVLLVGPGGQKAMIFSDVGGSGDINNVTLTLSDVAALALTASGQIVSGTYRPTDVEPGETGNLDTFSAPAPGGPYTAPLSAFTGQSANGTWSLYLVDDGPGDQGSFAGGWSLTIATADAGASATNVSVPPDPPIITSVTRDAGGAIQVTVSGETGFNYALEASSDLVTWMKVDVQTNEAGSIVFSEQPTTNSIRFYRAVSADE